MHGTGIDPGPCCLDMAMFLHATTYLTCLSSDIGVGIALEFFQAVCTAEIIIPVAVGMVQPAIRVLGTHATDRIDIFFTPVILP
jgi:hypothetical protein